MSHDPARPDSFGIADIIDSARTLTAKAVRQSRRWQSTIEDLPEFESTSTAGGDVVSPEIHRGNAIRQIAHPAAQTLNAIVHLRSNNDLHSASDWREFSQEHPALAELITSLILNADIGLQAAFGKRRVAEGPPFLVKDDSPSWNWLDELERIQPNIETWAGGNSPVGKGGYLKLILDEKNHRVSREGHTGRAEFKGRNREWEMFCFIYSNGQDYVSIDRLREFLEGDLEPKSITDLISEVKKIIKSMDIGIENARKLGYRVAAF